MNRIPSLYFRKEKKKKKGQHVTYVTEKHPNSSQANLGLTVNVAINERKQKGKDLNKKTPPF